MNEVTKIIIKINSWVNFIKKIAFEMLICFEFTTPIIYGVLCCMTSSGGLNWVEE